MTRFTYLAVAAVIVSASLTFSASVHAQTNSVTFPVLYNSSGQAVNSGTSGTSLPAGYYFTSPGGTQVYYYGNGTYYDPSTHLYGGTVNDPSGAAGVYYVNSSTGTVVGAPNTGAGGESPLMWFLLVASGIVAIGGISYLTRVAAVRALSR